MKFWRIFAAAVVVGLTIPTSVALADDDDDDDDMGGPGAVCAKETNKALRTDLVVCPGFMDYTNTFVGNGFPYENSSFFFSSFRNQYLYPSALFDATSAYACTVESISARSVSFVGGSTNVYASFPNGDPSTITVSGAVSNLAPTFSLNSSGSNVCQLTGTDAVPLVIGNRTGIRGSTVSTCLSCVQGDRECPIGNIENGLDASWGAGVLHDHTISVGTGNSGAGVWDTSDATFGTPACGGSASPERAFGSSTFANPNHLTTALGVDGFDFVWVFEGLAPPPPATVEQQIKEIIRLLLTPEALRCSGLDLNAGNGKIEDDPLAFPNGANWDPVQPTVTTGKPKTGDELIDGLRNAGFRP